MASAAKIISPELEPVPVRSSGMFRTAVTSVLSIGTGFALAIFPPVAAFASHMIERVSNHFKAREEFNVRAGWYRNQIATTLGMDPRNVKAKHLMQAAAINPLLASAVRDVNREETSDNKSSALINGAAALIPGGVMLKDGIGAVRAVSGLTNGLLHTGKLFAATAAGGLLASWTTKEHISAQEVIEGISNQLSAAREHGVDLRKAVTPQMVFLLRVAQDEGFGAHLEDSYKKPFHKMNEAEQKLVMHDFPALANAATSEAYAVANNMLPVQELMARTPNLNSRAADYKIGDANSSFAARVAEDRPKMLSYTDLVAAQRLAEVKNVNNVAG